MSEAKHTEGKIIICLSGTENNPSYALSSNGIIVFQTLGGNDENNANRLCLCWNNHDALIKALKAWQLYDSESGDKHPCPDYTLKVQYRDNARKLTEAVLDQIERETGDG